jgi:C4-dicarboxylate-binding protein DctP
MFNKQFLDKQPAEIRKILIDSAKEAGKYQREIIVKAEAEQLEMFKKAGVELITLTADQRMKFEQASRPVYKWFTEKYGSESLDMIRREVAISMKK